MQKKESGALRVWRVAERLELRLGTGIEHPYPKHWHEELFISAITGGAARFHFGGSEHLATRATLIVVLPGELHTHESGEGGRSFRSLHLPCSFLKEAAEELMWQGRALPGFSSGLLFRPKVFREFITLHRSMEQSETRLQEETGLLELAERLLRYLAGVSVGPQKIGREIEVVRRAQEFLHENFNREVTLKELAAQVNLSPYHFHRVFCSQTGLPPHAYQIQLRILHAKALLRKRWPLARVAYEAGFADQSHLTRLFNRFTGLTPARYAANSKNVQDGDAAYP